MSKKIPEIKVVSLTKNNFSRCITPHLDIKLVPLKNPDATLEDALGMYGIGVAAAVLMEWNAYCHWRSYGSDNPAYDNFEADIGCDLFYWAHCHSKKMISFMSTLPDYHPQSLVLDPHEKVKDLLARFPRIELNDFSLRIIAINYNPKEISMAQQTLVENMQPGKQYSYLLFFC